MNKKLLILLTLCAYLSQSNLLSMFNQKISPLKTAFKLALHNSNYSLLNNQLLNNQLSETRNNNINKNYSKITTSDSKEFFVTKNLLNNSETLKNMLNENLEDNNSTIDLPKVSSKTLSLILHALRQLETINNNDIQEIIDTVLKNKNAQEALDFFNAINYLDIKNLLLPTVKTILKKPRNNILIDENFLTFFFNLNEKILKEIAELINANNELNEFLNECVEKTKENDRRNPFLINNHDENNNYKNKLNFTILCDNYVIKSKKNMRDEKPYLSVNYKNQNKIISFFLNLLEKEDQNSYISLNYDKNKLYITSMNHSDNNPKTELIKIYDLNKLNFEPYCSIKVRDLKKFFPLPYDNGRAAIIKSILETNDGKYIIIQFREQIVNTGHDIECSDQLYIAIIENDNKISIDNYKKIITPKGLNYKEYLLEFKIKDEKFLLKKNGVFNRAALSNLKNLLSENLKKYGINSIDDIPSEALSAQSFELCEDRKNNHIKIKNLIAHFNNKTITKIFNLENHNEKPVIIYNNLITPNHGQSFFNYKCFSRLQKTIDKNQVIKNDKNQLIFNILSSKLNTKSTKLLNYDVELKLLKEFENLSPYDKLYFKKNTPKLMKYINEIKQQQLIAKSLD